MSAVEKPPVEKADVRADGEIRRLRGLVEARQFAQALPQASALLSEFPENRDAFYLVAVCQRYAGRIEDALATLRRFEAVHPTFGRLFQERGHAYRTLGKRREAIEAYERAVALNPALLSSWQMLSALWRSLGRPQEAQAADREASKLTPLPPPVLGAAGMLSEGDLDGAERVLRAFLQRHGDHVEAMRLLAQIGVAHDVLDDAEVLLEGAVRLGPDYTVARYDYAGVLSKRQKYAQALTESRKLLAVDPANRAFRIMYANACVGVGDHEEALCVFRSLAADPERRPDDADLHLSIAHALKTIGHQSEAIGAYREAARIRPDFGDAYWSLANLKTYRFDAALIDEMRRREAAPETAGVDRVHLCFALGKALEDRGEFAESFRYYERGNALKRAESRYSADTIEAGLRRQMSTFTPEFFAARVGWGCPAPDPIFIVGLPRAGSTLIEQILASHSKVEGTMELADIPRLVGRLQGRETKDREPVYPQVVTTLDRETAERLGAAFIEDTRVFRGSGAAARPFFIDKMPNNFRHLGLIRLILPNAKIIDARREALACCVSNFKQLFASGQEFTYSLEDIGRYYRAYVEVMEHWERVLPGWVLRVQHEAVVEDLEGSVRRILGFCGLEFEPQCLQYWKTERSVRTASSEQVRQPIFREGLEQWRHFEPWLGPLKHSLGTLAS